MSSILPSEEKDKKFIIFTEDYSGFGFSKMIIDAGYNCVLVTALKEEEEKEEEFNLVGRGIVPKITKKNFLSNKEKFKNYYIIFDFNHNWEIGEQLRSEGFKVFGGQELTYKMEKDRFFGTEIIKKANLETPQTHEFKTINDGLKFLDENIDSAYVFKPDDSGEGCFSTYVADSVRPEKANRELYAYMVSQDGEAGTYILQERIDGVEANLELWLYNGKPILAYGNFECKRKLNHDEGEMVGCSQDIGFIIPIDCKGIKLTIDKLLPQYRNYTGFLDMNVIISDNGIYFIEFCARFGYNAHPNIFLNLAKKTFPEIMSDWMDGKVENFQDNFKYGFGASITLYIDHPKQGYPIYISDEMMDKFYHFDTLKEDNDEENEYSLSGFSNEVGIVTAHAYTIVDAARQCLKNVDKVTFPNHSCRTDLDLDNYESSPLKRYDALMSMGFFTKII